MRIFRHISMHRLVPRRAAFACAALFALTTGVARPAATQSTSIPKPESVLGFPVGADLKLANYDESMRYFQELAKSSDYIKLINVGRTSTGHEWTLAVISSPANLAKLDHYRAVSYTHLRAHETGRNLVCRLLLEKKKKQQIIRKTKIIEKKRSYSLHKQ